MQKGVSVETVDLFTLRKINRSRAWGPKLLHIAVCFVWFGAHTMDINPVTSCPVFVVG